MREMLLFKGYRRGNMEHTGWAGAHHHPVDPGLFYFGYCAGPNSLTLSRHSINVCERKKGGRVPGKGHSHLKPSLADTSTHQESAVAGAPGDRETCPPGPCQAHPATCP